MLKLSKLNKATLPPGARSITSKNLIVGNNNQTAKRLQSLDIYGHVRSNLGIIKMNREHRYNTLTPNYTQDVSRAIETMNQEHIVESILMMPAKGEHFSNGTDFRTIAHMKREDNLDAVSKYLEQIYQLQAQMAKLNKPLISVAPGHSYNSGATLLAASGFPMTTLDAKVAFNEVTFGFVPHSGASYYLSRLPRDFGTFLALTGLPIHGSEAARMNITKGVVHLTKEYEEEVQEIVMAQEFSRYNYEDLTSPHPSFTRGTPWQSHLVLKNQLKKQGLKTDTNRKINAMGDNNPLTEEFIEARDRQPSSIYDAEFKYMHLLRQDRANNQEEEPGYLELSNPHDFAFVNRYKDNIDHLQTHLTSMLPSDRGEAANHLELIARCFYPNSVEEIMVNLEKEEHPFAKKCLEAMKNNSMLSMQLALKMLRRAINLDYTSCLQMEVNVATRKIQGKDFDFGVSERLMKPNPKDKTKIVPFAYEKVSESELEGYFEPNRFAQQINVGTVKNALLPTRHHYERFTDVVRLWVNQESTTQRDLRTLFDQHAKEALRLFGIDTRDKALTVESARDHLGALLQKERTEKVHQERMTQLMTDDKLRESYFSKIREQLDKYNDPQHFYSRVNEHITAIFENAYFEKLQQVYQKSKEAHDLEKRRMLIRIKKFLFKNRILAYSNKDDKQLTEQLKNFQFKQIHLTEKWDQNWRKQEHPYIQKSPIYHISQAVGRISLTLPELTREYLTKPENRKNMTALTFDKEELEKLQKDILEHPDKYIEMLTAPEKSEAIENQLYAEKKIWDRVDLKLAEKEYWYRVLNDGVCPLDSYPYYREFQAYKDWVDQIEDRAYDTLLFSVNSLVLSLSENKHTFEGEKDSRRKRIEKLQNMLLDKENEKKRPAKAKRGSSRKLSETTQDMQDLKSLLSSVLKEDIAFKHMFAEQNNSNSKIKAFQSEMETELLKLIEIVLLNKYGSQFNKEDVEKKLALFTQAQGWSKNGKLQQQHLNVIDSYLAEISGQAAVQEALDFVKPFFFKMIEARITEEADRVLDEFVVDKTRDDVMTQYLFAEKHGLEMSKSWVMEKWNNFNALQQDRDNAELAFPLLSRKFRRRLLVENLGFNKFNKNESIADQQVSSLKDTQKDLEMIKNFDDFAAKEDAEIAQEGRKIYGGDMYVDPRNEQNFFDVHEQREVNTWEVRYKEMQDFIRDHQYELNSNFTTFDMLHMYSKAILKQEMDFGGILEQTGYDYQDRKILHDSKRTEKHWEQLAEYAQFLKEFRTANNEMVEEVERRKLPAVDIGLIMSEMGQSQESIFQKAIADRNANLEKPFDRKAHTQNAITEFNSLQDIVQKTAAEKSQIRNLLASRTKEEREHVEQLLEGKNQFLDLQKLKKSLESESPIEFESLFHVEKLISSVKSGKSLSDFMERYADKKIDVLSLEEMKSLVKLDSSLDETQKTQIASVLDHVKQQTSYIAHSQRQNISLGQFLSKYHFSSSQAYTDYADDVLKKKIYQAIDGEKPKVIEWELGDSRTNPIDHHQHMTNDEIDNLLQDIYRQQEKEVEPITETNEFSLEKENHDSVRQYEMKRLLRDAIKVTKLPDEHEGLRNWYENEILFQLSVLDQSQAKTNELIEEYTDLRIKNCLLNPEFNKRLQIGENGFVYMRVLKDQVIRELRLTDEFELEKLSYYAKEKHQYNSHLLLDVEAPYELQSVNNTDAMGYDRLLERAQKFTKEAQFDEAQKTVLDKLLADYFLDQRHDYVQSNKMVKDLVEIFESEERKTRDVLYKDENLTLEQRLQKQNQDKMDEPIFVPENFRDLMELDTVVSRAMQKGKNGLSDRLRNAPVGEEAEVLRNVPEYFELFDVRKPADKYVEDKLEELVQAKFDQRRKLEKGMSRRELLAFDEMLSRHLEKATLLPELQKAIQSDYHDLFAGKHAVENGRERKRDKEIQFKKFDNKQKQENREIINPDSRYKYYAFAVLHEKEAAAAKTQSQKIEYMFNETNWSNYYRDQLLREQKMPAREVNPEDYQAKKPWEVDVGPYKTNREKEAEFFAQHGTYIENKKEQQDRIQLFYILEQFFEKTRTDQDQNKQLSDAQQHMADYFSDPDNTFFFDKNKIY